MAMMDMKEALLIDDLWNQKFDYMLSCEKIIPCSVKEFIQDKFKSKKIMKCEGIWRKD